MNQIVLTDDDDEEEGARVALVMRDAPSAAAQEIVMGVQPPCRGDDDESSKAAPSPAAGVIWAEAHVESQTDSSGSSPQEGAAAEVVAISQVAVVPVEIDNETLPTSIDVPSNVTDPTSYSQRTQEHYTNDPETAAEDGGIAEITLTPLAAPRTCSLYRWNFIVCAVGNALLVAAASTTFAFEISAIILYMLGAAFHVTAEGFSKLGEWTLPFQTLFRLLSVIFLSVDLILLTISTVLVELLSWIAGIVCILFGGITVGVAMHQHIRQVCQWICSIFRKVHAQWNPPRMEPHVFHDNDESLHDESESSTLYFW